MLLSTIMKVFLCFIRLWKKVVQRGWGTQRGGNILVERELGLVALKYCTHILPAYSHSVPESRWEF